MGVGRVRWGHNCTSDDLYVLSDFEMEKGPGDHRTSHSPMNLACQPLSGRRLRNSSKAPLCQAGAVLGLLRKGGSWIAQETCTEGRFQQLGPFPLSGRHTEVKGVTC